MQELEVKVLDIDVDAVQRCLLDQGWKFTGDYEQKVYVFDLPSIGSVYKDLLDFTQSDKMAYSYGREILLEKIQYFLDFAKQISHDSLQFDVDSLKKMSVDQLVTWLHSDWLKELVSKYGYNPYRWVRLRQTGKKTTLTVKSIANPLKKPDVLQEVQEYEVEVENLQDSLDILKAMGFCYRNYQQKRRISFEKGDAECAIDFWPKLSPYLEIEAKDAKSIQAILTSLDLSEHQVLSCNVEEIYKMNGFDIYAYRSLIDS